MDLAINVQVRSRNVEATFGPNSGSLRGGVEGPRGPAGATILSGTANPTGGIGADGDIYYRTDTHYIFGPKTAGAWGAGYALQGPQGLTGTITIGTVTTGAPGSEVEIDNVGTAENAILNITIPEGDQGVQGPAATIEVGDVTTTAPGGSASVTNSGTSGAAVLDFEIPTGDTGPTGPEAWAAPEDWATATAYTAVAPRSQVVFGGRSYVALISHTSAPAFSTDLAASRWKLVADKGADGTGTGTVVHTGTPSAGQLARFADGSGDVLEGIDIGAANDDDILDRQSGDGRYREQTDSVPADEVSFTPAGNIAATDVAGALAELDSEKQTAAQVGSAISSAVGALTKTSVGLGNVDNTSDVNKPISTATQAALDALSSQTADPSTTMRMMLAFAELKADQFYLPKGIADDFTGSDGVDAAASTGEVHNAVTKVYTNTTSAAGAADIMTTNSAPAGNTASASTEFDANYQAHKAFDNSSSSYWSASLVSSSGYIRRGFATPKAIGSFDITALTATPARAPGTFTLRGRNGGGSFTTIQSYSASGWTSGQTKSFTVTTPAAYDEYEWNITALGGAADYAAMANIAITFVALTVDMDLRSIDYVAGSAPTTAHLLITAKASGAFTLNTDLVAYVTRDDGTTWVTATLVLAEDVGGGFKAYEALGIDLTGTPSDTDTRWRIETSDAQSFEISAVVLLRSS